MASPHRPQGFAEKERRVAAAEPGEAAARAGSPVSGLFESSTHEGCANIEEMAMALFEKMRDEDAAADRGTPDA